MNLSNHVQNYDENAAMTDLEAEMVRSAAQSFATSESPLTLVRTAEAGDWSQINKSWEKLAQLGWLEILQYQETESEGLISACVIAEELGRAAYPLPFAEAATLALPLLAEYAQNKVDIESISLGNKRVAFALPLMGLPTKFERLAALDSDNVWIANQLDEAELLVIPTLQDGQPAIALINKPTSGWHSTPMPDLANNAYSRVSTEDLANAELIPVKWQSLSKAFDHFRLVTCAYIVGLSSQVADIAIEYAKERIAFDKPIGSFQAVQHRLAESALELSAAHLLVREASVTGDLSQVAIACIQTCEAGKKSTFTAQQIWAGMGYTMEVDVQLFFRRARAYQLLLGTPWELREKVWHEIVPHH